MTSSPRGLILTVFALYARERDNWLSVSSVIAMLEALGVDAAATRSSISRLKKRGVLEPERREGSAGYRLSADTLATLAEGDRRIWRARAEDDAGWLVVLFSVPEAQRDRRHELRSRLTGLGFANAASGAWVAPATLYDETVRSLERADLLAWTEFFRGEHLGTVSILDRVAQWWDLDALAGAHQSFTGAWEPARRRRAQDPEAAFATYVPMLTAWRRLPYVDPGLPLAALPSPWPGVASAELFGLLDERLRDGALRYATTVIDRR